MTKHANAKHGLPVCLASGCHTLCPDRANRTRSSARDFRNPPDDARIMMRWWWFGPAVTKPQLEREMRIMKAGGIGGFEVQPVYPLELDNPGEGIRNLPFFIR